MTLQAPTVTMQDHTLLDTGTDELLMKLDRIGRLAAAPRWRRLIHTPVKYIAGMFFRNIIYSATKKGIGVSACLFWGDTIEIKLPASMDIYLLGGKTDDAEIRLTRFIIKNLRKGDHFLDIGAHAGFYSLLAAFCVGENGKVLGIEASPKSFSMLQKNVSGKKNIEILNIALSNLEEMISFFEFPDMYAEYNTMDPQQFQNSLWFKTSKIEKLQVKAMQGDSLLEKYHLQPGIIKIDVEGAEHRVVKGLKTFLSECDPFVAMEFVRKNRDNHNHVLADKQLTALGFSAYSILPGGELDLISGNVEEHVEKFAVESDNIIYKKPIF